MIGREIESLIMNDIQDGKVLLLYGARRVGKTYLIEHISRQFQGKVNILNGEDYSVERFFAERTVNHYRQLLENTDLLIIDEAQNISEIGNILKFITDHVKDVSVIATGSSSFDLQNMSCEPLVGRSKEYRLYPFSLNELKSYETALQTLQKLDEMIVYGLYPELVHIKDFNNKKSYLHEIVNSYLMKDILMIDGVKNSSKMRNLLRLIALQIGNIVSYNEIGKQLSLSRNTVEKYLDLLTKTFVIYKLPAFSKNPRKELSKSAKWLFFDTGIRNAIISDFRPLALRNDAGVLWENFVISERIKFHNNNKRYVQFYFWKSNTGQEIDLIEVEDTHLHAFEMKLTAHVASPPSGFSKEYPDAVFITVNKENIFNCFDKK